MKTLGQNNFLTLTCKTKVGQSKIVKVGQSKKVGIH